jgi:hypothetical protein
MIERISVIFLIFSELFLSYVHEKRMRSSPTNIATGDKLQYIWPFLRKEQCS